jgi:hypothetical protein
LWGSAYPFQRERKPFPGPVGARKGKKQAIRDGACLLQRSLFGDAGECLQKKIDQNPALDIALVMQAVDGELVWCG